MAKPVPCEVGMQVPRCDCTEVSEETVVRSVEKTDRRDSEGIVPAERSQSGEKRLHGLHFWAVGYCVSTVGLDEKTIREYIQQQEKLETGQNKFDFE